MAQRNQAAFTDYEGFVAKFEPKKTTDDCYTPEGLYAAVRDWAVEEYGLQGRPLVRPFWPGGDFEAFEYPAGCVVLDNPPFSIISRIVRWYGERGIDFFLFAPNKTACGIRGCHKIFVGADTVYANGARVNTAFVTNLGDAELRSSASLTRAIAAAQT
ncbi:MAG: hypothetical protein IJP66_01360, partial [Kiritimatiellae bacterium]|nr:hypothetical protein [Kiritimatiellia bacterium]